MSQSVISSTHAEPSRSATILVVDDDPDMLALCQVRLQAEGFEVLLAPGSVEAQQICDEYPAKINLIILDVMLYPRNVEVDHARNVTPRIHGDKLLGILRQKRPLTHILIMSAVSPGLLQNRGLGWVKHRYPFLSKPFSKESLLTKVKEVLLGPLPANLPRT
jgi:DNA-binding response OmpR family regulator